MTPMSVYLILAPSRTPTSLLNTSGVKDFYSVQFGRGQNVL
jgi:hypothetical protein